MHLVSLDQDIAIAFRASLLHDMLTTLALLPAAQRAEGLSDWMYRTSDRLLASPPPGFLEIASSMAFVPGFNGWLMNNLPDDAPAHHDVQAILDFVAGLSVDDIGAALLRALHTRLHDIHPGSPPPQLLPEVIQAVERIQVHREGVNGLPLMVAPEALAALLLDPAAYQAALLTSLQILWDGGYGERHPEDVTRWETAVIYHERHPQQGDFEAIFRAVTGRVPHKFLRNYIEKTQRVEWLPCAHVGTFAVYNWEGGVLRISFNANLVPAIESGSLNLGEIYPALKALADETRLQILDLLVDGQEYNVGELADHLDLSQSNISRHLALLARTDIVQVRPQGTQRYYSLHPSGIGVVVEKLQALLLKERQA